jgi:hypothetical protein
MPKPACPLDRLQEMLSLRLEASLRRDWFWARVLKR